MILDTRPLLSAISSRLIPAILMTVAAHATAQECGSDCFLEPRPAACLEWSDELGSFAGSASAAAVDVMGNVVVAGNTIPVFPSIVSTIYVAKYDADGTDGCNNAEQWSSSFSDSDVAGRNLANSIVVDFDGNSYVAGVITNDESHAEGSAGVLKFFPDGYRVWARIVDQPADGALESTFKSIAIDPEGVVYAAGVEYAANGTDWNWIIARLDTLSGTTLWVNRYDPGNDGLGFYGDGPTQIIVDRRGNPIVTGQSAVDDDLDIITLRLDPNSGDIVWSAVEDDPATALYDFIPKVGSDLDCNVYVAGTHEGNTSFTDTEFVIVKYNSDGVQLWRDTHDPGADEAHANDMVVDPSGNVYITGYDDVGDFLTVKYPAEGGTAPAWGVQYSDGSNVAIAYAIALDFLGNPYVTGVTSTGAGTLEITTMKYAAADGTIPDPDYWPQIYDAGNETAFSVDIVVDNGSGAYVVGSSGGLDDQRFLVLKITQPAASIPRDSTVTPNFQLERSSVWDPEIPSFLVDYPFWNESWDEDFSLGGVEDGFGAILTMTTDGAFDIGFRAEASLGYFDATYPGTATITVQNGDKLAEGVPILISTDWELDKTARITSNGSPSLNAGITAEIGGAVGSNLDAESTIYAEAFGFTILDFKWFDIGFNVPSTYILSVAQLLGLAANWGNWFEFEDEYGVFEGEVRYPVMAASGRADENGVLTSSAEEVFFTLRGNVTTLLLAIVGKKNSLDYESDFFDASIAFFELFLLGELSVVQELAMEMLPEPGSDLSTPAVTLEFSKSNGTVFATRTVNLGEDVNDVIVPSTPDDDGIINITPIISTNAEFRNYTGLKAVPYIGFETVAVEASVHYKDLDLGSWDDCFLCPVEALGELPVSLYGTPTNPRDWGLEFPEYTGDPITVVADTMTTLFAASRASATMLIYDQINPKQSFFNADVNDEFAMLLYGDGFTSNGQARICHYGRLEEIDTTFLNNNTLLVEIPNRFRLLPGIARITVDDLTLSNSLDFSIEFPSPNLATVNPNLWAADPDLATIPVSVIDGFTPAGHHTYIARRDYFIKMRDELWNSSTAGGIGAVEYFPNFNFDETPAFPLVSFDDMPMPRFVQPVDNGIHNIRLPEFAYSTPGLKEVLLANPVPGGGSSNVIQLTVAAPCPVISELIPASIPPDSLADEVTEFVLEVRGPAHVPTWDGFEEPKFGNFNAASVVRWDGVDVPTKFVNSSVLLATITVDKVEDYGNHNITVFTPDNDSEYFEQLMIDPDGDGQQEIFWQGNVPSGCRVIDVVSDEPVLECQSAPIVFAVTYPTPVIESVSLPVIGACSLAIENSAGSNFSVVGSHFAPGADVHLNGGVRTTTRVSDSLLQITLKAEDVANVGTLDIFVTNPLPAGGQSNTYMVTVALEDCDANEDSDQCEIADGVSLDCNANFVPDPCDITAGTSEDGNGNGIPDECDTGNQSEPSLCEGDANGDGWVDPLDSGFVLSRFGCAVGKGDYGCDAADANGDGHVDPLDSGFVMARFGACSK